MQRITKFSHNNRVLVLILVLIVSAFLMFSCSEDSTGPNEENPTENWDIVIDDGIGSGSWELELMPDSTIISTGSWVFDYSGSEVSCNFISAAFTFNNTDFTFNADGTAHNSGINQDSDFNMTVSGSLFNGNGNGEYEIDFAQSQWPDQSGSWTGNLNNGEGVTPTGAVNPPSNPNPEDNATSVSTNTDLSWECSDPDGDPLTYDVYFGTSSNPPLVNSGQSETTYNPGTLDEETSYYWKVKAHYDHSNSTTGDVWEFTTTGATPGEIVFVQGGTFDMGDHHDEGGSDELPVHSVTLDDFYIGETEVTHQQVIDVFNWAYSQGYINCSSSSVTNNQGDSQELLDLDDGDCAIDWNGSSLEFGGSSVAPTADCPCIEISWYGSVAYCNYKSLQEGLDTCYDLSDWSCDRAANGYRLPTEAEWEYAARGGINWTDDYRYSGCHNESDLPDYAWYDPNAGGETHPVGTKLPNQLAIYDMSGNVWEWCWDWYGSNYYSISPSANPTGSNSGPYRVRRGGHWFSRANYCRVAYRSSSSPGSSFNGMGFRILRANLD